MNLQSGNFDILRTLPHPIFPLLRKIINFLEISFNPIQRGVFFANRKRGGGAYMPPQCIFGIFFGAPPKYFFSTICFIGLMGS